MFERASGRSTVEDFIASLQQQDQAQLAEVIDGIEKQGLDYSRVHLKPLRAKLWEIKF
jgi:hypothetical protein